MSNKIKYMVYGLSVKLVTVHNWLRCIGVDEFFSEKFFFFLKVVDYPYY